MPCSNRKARILLKEGKAKIHQYNPFTIQLIIPTGETIQNVSVGVDTGAVHIGIAVTSENKILEKGEVELRDGIHKSMTLRFTLRRSRRNRNTRYRKSRYLNRKRNINKWLPPTIQSKIDATFRWIDEFCSLVPDPKLYIEVGKFNPHKMINNDIQDEEYQQLVDKFGKENVAKIAPEDLTYAYQIKNIGDMSFEELQAEIQRLKDEENDPTNIYFSFSSAWNSSDFSDAKKELLELAKSGEITADVLESTEEYNSLLSKTGLTAEEAKDKITNLLTAQEKLAAASNGLDSLSSAFEEFKDIGFVTAQTLESLPDVFKKLGGWDIFSGIVGSGTSTADEVQQAFNDIVKQYLIAQNTFSGLIGTSEAEIQSYIANLKQMGVTNAEEVVKQAQIALTEQNNLLAEAEAEAYEGYTRYLENKSEAELAFLEDSGSKNGQLVATLGSAYQQDYQNWQSLLSKKAEAYNAFVNALGGAYNKSLSLAQNIQKNKKQTVVGFNELAAADAAQAQYEEIEYQLKKATQALQLDLSTIDTNFGSSFSPSYSGTRGTSNKKSKEE